MAQSDETIRINVRDALADIAQLKGGLADLRSEMGKTNKASENAFGGESALKEAREIERVKKLYAEIKQSADTLRTALKNAYDPRAVATYSAALAKAEVAQKKIESGAKQIGVNLKEAGKQGGLAGNLISESFGAITKATVILALVKAVYDLAKGGIELSNQYSKAQKQFTAFLGSAGESDKVLGSLIDTANRNFLDTGEVIEAGKSLLAFGEAADNLPSVLTRIADISAATGKNFNELALIYGKARTAGVLYAEDINQLVDAGIPIIQEFANQLGVSTSEVKKLASEGKIGFEELQLAFFNLTQEGAKFSNQAEAQAETLPGLYKSLVNRVKPLLTDLGDTFSFYVKGFLKDVNELLDLFGVANKAADDGGRSTKKSIDNLRALRDEAGKEQAIDNTVTSRNKLQAANDALLAAERDFYEQGKEQREDAGILEEAAIKARLERTKKGGKDTKAERDKQLKEQADYNKRLAELQLQKLDPDSEAFAIAKENLRFADQLAEFKKFNLDTEEIEKLHQANLFDIRDEFENIRQKQAQESAQRFAEIYAQAVKDDEEANKKRRDDLQKELEYQRDLGEARIDVQEEIGKGVIIALEKAGAKEADIKEAQAQLDLEIQGLRLQNELEFQQNIRAAIADGDTKKLAEVQAAIDKIKAAIANNAAAKTEGGKQKSFLESLGLSGDDLKKATTDLESAAKSIVSFLQDISDAQIAKAEAAIEAAEKETDAAQEAFDKEKELADEGFANNLDTATKNLEAAKANEEKALQLKKDAQRKQLALDSAIQLSSLITAAAGIFKGFSTIPLVGQILAVAAVAAMFASFAAARSKAAQAIKFREGGEGKVDSRGVIRGASHDRGGVPFEAEGGEFFATDGSRFSVVNKAMTAKEFSLLSAINKNDQHGMDRWAMERVARLDRKAVGAAIGEGRGSATVIRTPEDRKAHRLLAQIRDRKSEGQTSIEGGYAVTRANGRTVRTRLQ